MTEVQSVKAVLGLFRLAGKVHYDLVARAKEVRKVSSFARPKHRPRARFKREYLLKCSGSDLKETMSVLQPEVAKFCIFSLISRRTSFPQSSADDYSIRST